MTPALTGCERLPPERMQREVSTAPGAVPGCPRLPTGLLMGYTLVLSSQSQAGTTGSELTGTRGCRTRSRGCGEGLVGGTTLLPQSRMRKGQLGRTEKKIHQGALGSAGGKEPEGTVFMQLPSSTHLALGCLFTRGSQSTSVVAQECCPQPSAGQGQPGALRSCRTCSSTHKPPGWAWPRSPLSWSCP